MLDSRFRDWAHAADAETEACWKNWLHDNPERAELAHQAKKMIQDLNAWNAQLKADEKAQLWSYIHARKEAEAVPIIKKEEPKAGAVIVMLQQSRFWPLAACVAAILLCGAAFLWSRSARKQEPLAQYSTNYSQVKQVTLPDGSRVVLNANSTLRVAKGWNRNAVREVQLNGEAFFTVTHQKNNQKFRVQLANGLAVEVLGTKFTVTRRPQKTRVVLNEGKVKVSITEEHLLGLTSTTKAAAVLQPGELLEVRHDAVFLPKRQVANPAIYAAFRNHKMAFADTPLAEVARVLQDTYGYQVSFANAAIANRRFTGTIPTNRIDILFTALEKLFNLKITEEGKQIKIT